MPTFAIKEATTTCSSMKATFLIVFVLVAQVFASSFPVTDDSADPEEQETNIDSLSIIADSVTRLFSLPDSSLINVANDIYSFRLVFNTIRDSLILFYTEHPEEPLDSQRQEVLLNWACRYPKLCNTKTPVESGFYISRGQFQIFEDNDDEEIGHAL